MDVENDTEENALTDDRKIELNSRLDGRLPNVQEDCLYNLKRLAEITLAYFNYQDTRKNTDEVSRIIQMVRNISQKCAFKSACSRLTLLDVRCKS